MTPEVPGMTFFRLTGSVEGLLALGGCGVVVAVMVVAINSWLRWQRIKAESQNKVDLNAVEATHAYRRYLVAAAWAGGSTRDWDHSVRPLLADLVELVMAEQLPSGADPRVAASERLGPELWALVDPDLSRSEDRSTPGAGRDVLLQILRRVDAP